MPIYDHKCEEGHFTEEVKSVDDRETKCRKCGKVATRVISMTGVNCVNEDAPWIRSVLEVVEKGTDRPHCNEFLKNPTRSNYHKWMKGEGIRPMDEGEGNISVYEKEREEKERERRTVDQLMKKRQERRRIIVHG